MAKAQILIKNCFAMSCLEIDLKNRHGTNFASSSHPLEKIYSISFTAEQLIRVVWTFLWSISPLSFFLSPSETRYHFSKYVLCMHYTILHYFSIVTISIFYWPPPHSSPWAICRLALWVWMTHPHFYLVTECGTLGDATYRTHNHHLCMAHYSSNFHCICIY